MTWQERHLMHRSSPVGSAELRVTLLLDAMTMSIDHHLNAGGSFPDSNTSEAYGRMLDGFLLLLNENLGGLDAGSLWDEVAQLATKVGWNLDISEINWENG